MQIEEWIKAIRSSDAMTFENAYFGDRPTGPNVVLRFISELLLSKDPFTRGKFCELLGEMGDAAAIPVLLNELNHADNQVREWAAAAIKELESVDIRTEKRAWVAQFKPGQ